MRVGTDDTLARINDYANDVEMQVRDALLHGLSWVDAFRLQGPANAGPTLYLVLDTNVLIDNLQVIRASSEDVDNGKSTYKPLV